VMPQDEQTAEYSDALQNSEAYAGTSLGASDSCRRALTVMAGALLAVTMLAVTVVVTAGSVTVASKKLEQSDSRSVKGGSPGNFVPVTLRPQACTMQTNTPVSESSVRLLRYSDVCNSNCFKFVPCAMSSHLGV